MRSYFQRLTIYMKIHNNIVYTYIYKKYFVKCKLTKSSVKLWYNKGCIQHRQNYTLKPSQFTSFFHNQQLDTYKVDVKSSLRPSYLSINKLTGLTNSYPKSIYAKL
jgi:hypothetical protein